MNECRVHRYAIYDVQPSAVTCLRYNKQLSCLALSRGNGSIEIWKHYKDRCWDQFGFIPFDEDRPIDTLEWTKYGQLISSGIDGSITQYDVSKCMPIHTFDTGSGAVWAMRHSPVEDLVAIGGEDGIVRLYEVLEDTTDCCLQYSKCFERQESRILSIAWHPRGKQLCTSGVNIVRIWNSQTGRMSRQLTLPKENKTDLAVWSCLFLVDNTVVVGDSLGRVLFYDGKLGSLLQIFKLHEADILALAVSPTENQIFASGVDPLFVSFEMIRIQDREEGDVGREYCWRRSWGHKMHSHDVRSIEIVGSHVLTGGVDTKVVVAKQKRKEGEMSKTSTILKSFRQTKICSISKEKQIFMLQGEAKVDLWKMTKILPSTQTETHSDGDCIPTEPPLHLATINSESIRSSKISEDGKFLAFSTLNNFRLYKVDIENFHVQISKLDIEIPQNQLPVLCLEFSPDGSRLYYGNSISHINVLDLSDENNVKHLKPITITAKTPQNSSLRDIAISNDGNRIIAMGENTYLYNIEQKSHVKLPSSTTAFTAIGFIGDNGSETIMAGTASRDIHEFTLDGEYTDWSNNSLIPKVWREYKSKLTSISQLDKQSPIVMCDNESFTLVNRDMKKKNHIRKIKDVEAENNKNQKGEQPKAEFTEVSRWKYVLHCEMIGKGDLLLIERPVGEVMDSLPPTLKQKSFALK